MQRSRFLRLVLLFSCLQIAHGAPVDDKEERFALNYLKDYHYLSPLKNGNHNFKDALRIFQQHADIPDTGHLDTKTIAEMHKPRCGVPDLDEEDNFNSGTAKRFSVISNKWKKLKLTYKFNNYAKNGGLTSAEQRIILDKAFKRWQGISPLSFTDVTGSSTSADITISFLVGIHSPCTNNFDQAGGKLAHAFQPESGTVHFDNDETFTDGVSSGTNLFSVALHEIGHLLGLSHSLNSLAIMHKTYKDYDPNMKLTDDDKNGIDYLYAEGTAKPDTSTPTPCIDQDPNCGNYTDRCDEVGMHHLCAQTCGQCGGQGLGSCKDKLVVQCPIYKKQYKLCGNSLVKELCKKTCNNCNSG